MSEMIRKVSLALYTRRQMGSWTDEDLARTAIDAMREPSDQMIDAGVEAKMKLYEKMEAEGVNTRTVVVANHPAGTIYVAMIEEALKEPTP